MKKLFIILLLSCFLLVGCGKTESNNQTKTDTKKEEVLVCSKKIENTVDFITEMSYYFENDKIVRLGIKYVYDLSPYTEEQRNAFGTSKMCETESIKDTLGMVNCQEALNGTDYIVTGDSENLLKKATGSLEANKKSYIADGWDCTVK